MRDEKMHKIEVVTEYLIYTVYIEHITTTSTKL